MSLSWKIVAASIPGTSHARRAAPCQDAFAFRRIEIVSGEILTIAMADGAGSADRGGEGAAFVCDFFVSGVVSLFENGGDFADLNENFCREFVKTLHSALAAKIENQKVSDYACTFLTAAVSESAAVFAQIGDGAIVYSEKADDFRLFAAPQRGEYANSTYFVTDESAAEMLQFASVEKRILELAIFTDGLQRLAIDFQSNKAHQPFFRSMLAPLRVENADAAILEKKLSEFLDSPKINERTDDDKTLILASRRKNE